MASEHTSNARMNTQLPTVKNTPDTASLSTSEQAAQTRRYMGKLNSPIHKIQVIDELNAASVVFTGFLKKGVYRSINGTTATSVPKSEPQTCPFTYAVAMKIVSTNEILSKRQRTIHQDPCTKSFSK
jgi:hypothetical protein